MSIFQSIFLAMFVWFICSIILYAIFSEWAMKGTTYGHFVFAILIFPLIIFSKVLVAVINIWNTEIPDKKKLSTDIEKPRIIRIDKRV